MSKEIYIDFIINELEKGNVKYNDVCSLFCTNFQLTERSFAKYWVNANEAYKLKRDAINEAKLNETIKLEKEAVKTIIKSKLERLEIYQKEIENCVKELTHGFTEETKSTGELINRPLTISEKALLRKTIKDLQSEISKIEGDYASTKVEQTNTTIEVIRKNADSIE
jgi:hypothetical protein